MHEITQFQPGFPPPAPCPNPLVSGPCSRTNHLDVEALARAVVQGVRRSRLRQRCEFALPGDGEAVKYETHFAARTLSLLALAPVACRHRHPHPVGWSLVRRPLVRSAFPLRPQPASRHPRPLMRP